MCHCPRSTRNCAGAVLGSASRTSDCSMMLTLHGLENVNAMYKEYHALGGNGTVTSLVNSIRELEVRDDKRPASQE